MKPFPSRKSPRLIGYDYTQAGAYFVTVCVHNRRPLFGEIQQQVLHLNSAGDMVANWWAELPKKYPGVLIDAFVVMPNHMHGVVVLEDAGTNVANVPALPTVVGWFKAMTTNAYIRGIREADWPPFEQSLWQRSFHDHIIRSEQSLNAICEYIDNNPARWVEDVFYLDATP